MHDADLHFWLNDEHVIVRDVSPNTTLLQYLRGPLRLSGTKEGCAEGDCGACTVLLDGRLARSCLALAADVGDREVTTVEGLAQGAALSVVQRALVEAGAIQCGFCTPGQILSAIACIAEGHAGNDDDLREFMSGNICRCAAYPHIVAAIRQVADQTAGGGDAAL